MQVNRRLQESTEGGGGKRVAPPLEGSGTADPKVGMGIKGGGLINGGAVINGGGL